MSNIKLKIESAELEYKKLVAEKVIKEMKEEKDKKLAKDKLFYLIFELILQLIGFGLILFNYGFILAIAIYLILWGNNMGVIRTSFTQFKHFNDMWKSN